jgi:hypothetical protein
MVDEKCFCQQRKSWGFKLRDLKFQSVSGQSLSKGCHLDVVRGPSTPHDPESDPGGSLSSWQSHPAGKVKDEGKS